MTIIYYVFKTSICAIFSESRDLQTPFSKILIVPGILLKYNARIAIFFVKQAYLCIGQRYMLKA